MQCVAWTGMLIERSAERDFASAVSSTFSGAEPCVLCEAIADFQDDEQPQHLERWRIEALLRDTQPQLPRPHPYRCVPIEMTCRLTGAGPNIEPRPPC